jgi:hypothetical protein
MSSLQIASAASYTTFCQRTRNEEKDAGGKGSFVEVEPCGVDASLLADMKFQDILLEWHQQILNS